MEIFLFFNCPILRGGGLLKPHFLRGLLPEGLQVEILVIPNWLYILIQGFLSLLALILL